MPGSATVCRTASGLPAFRLLEYDDRLAPDFDAIRREWVTEVFTLESNDIKIIENPKSMIPARGREILFVEADGLGIVGTCALMPVDTTRLELTKRGVRATARGLKAGEFRLQLILERARQMPISELVLLTNTKCAGAIRSAGRQASCTMRTSWNAMANAMPAATSPCPST